MSDSWRAETLTDLTAAAELIVADTTVCSCPETPHQNALHDLAHDLIRLVGERVIRPGATGAGQ